jgi:hypothetical protein
MIPIRLRPASMLAGPSGGPYRRIAIETTAGSVRAPLSDRECEVAPLLSCVVRFSSLARTVRCARNRVGSRGQGRACLGDYWPIFCAGRAAGVNLTVMNVGVRLIRMVGDAIRPGGTVAVRGHNLTDEHERRNLEGDYVSALLRLLEYLHSEPNTEPRRLDHFRSLAENAVDFPGERSLVRSTYRSRFPGSS